jgi:hypothetical protein
MNIRVAALPPPAPIGVPSGLPPATLPEPVIQDQEEETVRVKGKNIDTDAVIKMLEELSNSSNQQIEFINQKEKELNDLGATLFKPMIKYMEKRMTDLNMQDPKSIEPSGLKYFYQTSNQIYNSLDKISKELDVARKKIQDSIPAIEQLKIVVKNS